MRKCEEKIVTKRVKERTGDYKLYEYTESKGEEEEEKRFVDGIFIVVGLDVIKRVGRNDGGRRRGRKGRAKERGRRRRREGLREKERRRGKRK